MQTGSIVDFYDDPTGIVLKEKLAQAKVPEFIRRSEFLNQEKRASLPDEAFALILVDRGHKLRKYACVDKGNTALNVIYFMENQDKLSPEATKVAAANLLGACQQFKLAAPLALRKLANKKTLPRMKGKSKAADLTGTEVMPTQSDPAAGDADMQKSASANYVDVTGFKPAPQVQHRSYSNYCLTKEGQGRFPIDSYGQVLEANKWFQDHGDSLHPADRREYCTKLASRANEIGVKVTDRIRKYAGAGFAPDGELQMAVSTRMQFFSSGDPERGMLEGMMDKHASANPDVFCEALRQFDELTGLDQHWDHHVMDPWYTTYGINKTAEEGEWVWQQGVDRVTGEQLAKGCQNNVGLITRKFGEELALELCKDPKKIFESLPLDSKRILSRIATDPQF